MVSIALTYLPENVYFSNILMTVQRRKWMYLLNIEDRKARFIVPQSKKRVPCVFEGEILRDYGDYIKGRVTEIISMDDIKTRRESYVYIPPAGSSSSILSITSDGDVEIFSVKGVLGRMYNGAIAAVYPTRKINRRELLNGGIWKISLVSRIYTERGGYFIAIPKKREKEARAIVTRDEIYSYLDSVMPKEMKRREEKERASWRILHS